MKRIFISSILFGSLFSSAFAASYDVLGPGAASCGTWTQGRQAFGSSTTTEAQKSWLLGYIVGVESEKSSEQNQSMAISTDADGIFGWIDNYCHANPTRQLSSAANEFAAESGTIVKYDGQQQ